MNTAGSDGKQLAYQNDGLSSPSAAGSRLKSIFERLRAQSSSANAGQGEVNGTAKQPETITNDELKANSKILKHRPRSRPRPTSAVSAPAPLLGCVGGLSQDDDDEDMIPLRNSHRRPSTRPSASAAKQRQTRCRSFAAKAEECASAEVSQKVLMCPNYALQ